MSVTAHDRHDSPYRGLQPYTAADRAYFFGRDRDREIIISNLFAAPLTILYGASGVGKSSVLLAGVVPELRATPRLAVVVFREWQDAGFEAALKGAVLKALAEAAGREFEVDAALEFDEFLLASARAFRGQIFFILDQFEEYFLYHPPSPQTEEFDAAFARAVNRAEVGANFLLSMRDDGLSRLDRFRKRIPNLLGNMLRLEHLDRAAASEAIRRPLERYNELHANGGARAGVEEPLVSVLLEDLRTGKVTLDLSGQGKVEPSARGAHSGRIETPFLQVVLERLWAEERDAADHPDSAQRLLRLSTYERLGRATTIVRTHLDKAMETEALAPHRDASAALFHYLVTPGGQKIAHTPADLASYTGRPPAEVETVLNALSHPGTRILRPVAPPPDQPGALRYEIFHDVLAPAILDWRTRYASVKEREEAERLAEEQRREAETQARVARRFRRLAYALAAVCLIALAAVGVAAAYAVKSQRLAEEGRELKQEGERLTALAADAQIKADEAQGVADATARDLIDLAREAEGAQTRAEEAQAAAAAAKKVADAALLRARAEAANAVRLKAAAEQAKADAEAAELRTQEAQGFTALEVEIRKAMQDAELESRTLDPLVAVSQYQYALGLLDKKSEKDYYGEASINYYIGDVYRRVGTFGSREFYGTGPEAEASRKEKVAHIAAAERHFERARELYASAGSDPGEVSTLTTRAAMYEAAAGGDSQGTRDAAKKQDKESFEQHVRGAVKNYKAVFTRYEQGGNPENALLALEKLVSLSADLPDDESKKDVADYNQKLIPIYLKKNNLQRAFVAARAAAASLDSLGRRDEAIQVFNDLLGKVGDDQPLLRGQIYEGIGELQAKSEKREDKEAAVKTYGEALRQYERPSEKTGRPVSHVLTRGQTLNKLGTLYEGLGHKVPALEHYSRAVLLYREYYNTNRKRDARDITKIMATNAFASALSKVAALQLEAGRKAQAIETYKEALAAYEEINNRPGRERTSKALAAIYKSLGDQQNAEEFERKAREAEAPKKEVEEEPKEEPAADRP